MTTMNGDERIKDTEYNFYALTPIDDVDINVYESALDFVFAHDNVRNVAVSGSYGAGKSSVLASYKKKHNDKKFLHISLAHFHSADGNKDKADDGDRAQGENDDKSNRGNISPIETILEGKILNQLIHQISPDRIPRTNFRVKKDTSKCRNIFTTILAGTGILLGLYVFFFERWATFIQSLTVDWLKNRLDFSVYSESRLVAGIGFLAVAGIFLYSFVELQKSRHIIKKADVSGVEIEIFEDSNESYFDKYLNEVLYLFEKTDADVIVFEDIDRYDTSDIFERLHEINTLVNNNRKKKPLRFFCHKKKPLRFFYLMRDDIFVNKDRTKFFDFIIPIVPVIDASNSFNKFIECFEKSGLIEKEKAVIGLEFLQGLSLYIDDMRILQNICNEFLVYHGRLSTTEQDPHKMLALIAFKNLFPRDFADLQLGSGFMFEVIGGNGKTRLISTEKEQLQKIIIDKTAELNAVKNESAFADEIAIIYLNKLVDILPNHGISRSGNAQYCRQQLESYRNQRYTANGVTNVIVEYDNRLKFSAVDEKLRNSRIKELEDEIATSKSQFTSITEHRLKDIINRENIENLFKAVFTSETGNVEEFSKLKDSPYFALLKYLVREGFIDESYSDYITYFYENSLSRVDKVFLRSVTDKKGKDVTYKLDKPQMVVERLPLAYFEQQETLNFDLFEFLLSDYDTDCNFGDKTKRLIGQIRSGKYFTFIFDYGHQQNELMTLVKAFGVEWKSFVSDLFVAQNIGDTPTVPATSNDIFVKRFAYAFFHLLGEDKSRLSYLDEDSTAKLAEYVSNNTDFLAVSECDDQCVALGIKRLGVSFVAINADTARRSLFEAVYRKNLYDINFGNIKTMLKTFYADPDITNLCSANYTVIIAEPGSPLAKYIDDNIDDYMTVVLDECGETITDALENVVALLNNESIEKTKRLSYIAYLRTTISEILDINDITLWGELLKNSTAVEYSASNVIAYFFGVCKKAFDDTLISYMNTNKASVVFDEDSFSDKSEKETFFDALVAAFQLEDGIYKELIKQFDYSYTAFDVSGLPMEKLAILDELDFIDTTPDSLKFMREQYSEYLYTFIVNHIEKYLTVVSDPAVFIRDEMLKLLKSDISVEYKLELLKLDNTVISVRDGNYPDVVCAHILTNNYDAEDFNSLLENYSNHGKQTRTVILEIAINHMNNVFAVINSVDRQLLLALFDSDKVNEENKKTIFKTLALTASEAEIKQWLPRVGSEDFLAIFDDNKRPRYENTEWNKSLLEIFKGKKLIKDFKLNEQGGKYTITRWRKGQAKDDFID